MKKQLLSIFFCLAIIVCKSQITLSVFEYSTLCNGGGCDGGAVAMASGGTPDYNYTYSWNFGDTTSSVWGLCVGTYTVTVFDSIGNSASAIANITEPTPLVLQPINSDTICFGQLYMLTAVATGGTAPYITTWDSLVVGPTFLVSPDTTTTYNVIVIDANGCMATQTNITLFVNPPLSVVLSSDTTICIGGSTVLTANAFGGGGDTLIYDWEPFGTGATSSVIVSPTSTTTYTITINDDCTPSPAIGFVTITVDACTEIQSIKIDNTDIKLFPNPFISQTTIDLNKDYENATLKVLDVLGKELKSINFSGKQVVLEREELNNGIYFIQIISNDKLIATHKIIIN